nr:MAG TPA: hypothetical protein [Caudoviricetes sp.]
MVRLHADLLHPSIERFFVINNASFPITKPFSF